MMKLVLSLTLISWMIFSPAGALQCQGCLNQNCTTTTNTTCALNSTCLTSSALLTLSGVTSEGIVKQCIPASTCSPGMQTFSQSIFNFSLVLNATCCNTDNCNSQTLNFPATPSNNNLQCYTCATANCTQTQILQCRGVENRCFQTEVSDGNITVQTLGCASANLCTAGSNPSVTQSVANITCCGTSLCNTAPPTTTTTTTMFLLLGLLVFSLY